MDYIRFVADGFNFEDREYRFSDETQEAIVNSAKNGTLMDAVIVFKDEIDEMDYIIHIITCGYSSENESVTIKYLPHSGTTMASQTIYLGVA